MALIFRMHTPEDEPALVRLWSQSSGWDDVDVDTWAHRLLRPPFGPASIVVAEDAALGEIVGQLAFIPCRVTAGNRNILAFRAFAPIFAPAARSRNPVTRMHPLLKMYFHGATALRERGGAIIYMMPDPRWVRFLRPFPDLLTGSFPFWSLPLPRSIPLPLDGGHSAAPLQGWDDEMDDLWRISSRRHQCQLVRTAEALRWKVGSGDYHLTAVRRTGELVGFAASRAKGDRQWLICDTMARDDAALRATIVAATNVANDAAQDVDVSAPIRKVGVLATAPMIPTLAELGYARDAYDFPLMVYLLDTSLPKDDVHPSRWYLSAND